MKLSLLANNAALMSHDNYITIFQSFVILFVKVLHLARHLDGAATPFSYACRAFLSTAVCERVLTVKGVLSGGAEWGCYGFS